MNNKKNWLTEIKSTLENEIFKNESAQIKSKALLKELLSNITSYEKRWTFDEYRIVKNLIALNFALEQIPSSDFELSEFNEYALQIARLWESIGKLKEITDSSFAYINAAIAYEIAGFHANSLCLAKDILIQKNFEDDTYNLEYLTLLFLQRRLIRLKTICKQILLPSKKFESKYELLFNAGMAKSGEGFINISNYLLTGKEAYYDTCLKAFDDSMTLFFHIKAINEYSLISSIKSLLPIIKSRSIWTLLGSIASENQLFYFYLDLIKSEKKYKNNVLNLFFLLIETYYIICPTTPISNLF
jgi:hypothetical protein